MSLHLLKNITSLKRKKRVGRGPGSGLGQTAGRGQKGQKARSGGKVRRGFEGGQMPLHRRLPKFGFNNANFTKDYAIVNLEQLESIIDDFDKDYTITTLDLKSKGLIRNLTEPVKLLGKGNVSKIIRLKVDACSKSALNKIQSQGGSVIFE